MHIPAEPECSRYRKWMIEQIKSEIGYMIEYQLGKNDFLVLPDDYVIGS